MTTHTMTGVMDDDLGESAIASFRPKKSGEQVVSVSSGDHEGANRALLALPAYIKSCGGIDGLAIVAATYCYKEHGLDLAKWVDAVEKDATLNDQMQSLDPDDQMQFMIKVATAEAKLQDNEVEGDT